MGLGGTAHKTLDEHRDKRVFIYRVGRNTSRNATSVLGVSLHITLTLLEFQELISSLELIPWQHKRLFDPCLEDI